LLYLIFIYFLDPISEGQTVSRFNTTDSGFLSSEGLDRIVIFIKDVIVGGLDLWNAEVFFIYLFIYFILAVELLRSKN